MDKNLKIGIIGLGLIGGSIYKALENDFEIYAVTRNKSTIEKCKNTSDNLENIKNCDVIFVCTPMNKTLQILDNLNNILTEDTIVSDVCSLKEFLTKKEYKFKFIPAHPMAGTENSGFDASFATLFKGAKWVLTPFVNTKKEDIEKIEKIIKCLGAIPIFASAKEHDEAVALISHMPMLISQAIFKNAQDNELAMTLASSGFRDMTRLAMSNVEMAEDMINMNSKNIQKSLLKLYSNIGELLSDNYKTQISEIKEKRSKMF